MSQASTTGWRPIGLGRPGLRTGLQPVRSGHIHLGQTREIDLEESLILHLYIYIIT